MQDTIKSEETYDSIDPRPVTGALFIWLFLVFVWGGGGSSLSYHMERLLSS